MSLRVAAKVRLVISQDNSSNPQEPTFDSGTKEIADTASYAESAGFAFKVAAGAVDQQVDMGSLAEINALYLMAKGTGLLIKLVPVGFTLADVEAYEIVANFPAVIPFKLASLYVSNPGMAGVTLIMGAAGN